MADMTTALPPGEAGPPERRHAGEGSPVRPIITIWVVLTVLLEVFALFVPAHLMGVAASKVMVDIESSVTVFSVAAAPVAALVWSVAIYSLLRWRYRGPQDRPPALDGPPIRGNRPVQIIWLVVSSALSLFLFIWGLAEMQAINSSASTVNPLVIDVTGQQWLWTYRYPDAGGYTTETLYLPVNRPVVFDVTSEDVVHSFWIVQMGVKIDANPGEITTTSVTPDRLGTYTVRCAELCGLDHAYMESNVRVISDAAFARWVNVNSGRRGNG